MKAHLIIVVVALVAAATLDAYPNGSGVATTTRYWDCCKPTCSWTANAGAVTAPVKTCAADGIKELGPNTKNGCDDGGNGYICNDLKPFVVNGQAYGFAAARINSQSSQATCCACYKLQFTKAPLQGKSIIVQLVNTGNDLKNNQFDMQMPAGGMGIFTKGCAKQWPKTPANAWGDQYGGVKAVSQCGGVPAPLKPGCEFRFNWYKGADNPTANFQRVACPKVLTDRSKCKRKDD